MLHVLHSSRENLESYEVPGASNGNYDTRQDFHGSGGGDNLRLDTSASDQEVDLGPCVVLIQGRRDEAHGCQTAIFPLNHSTLRMVPVPTQPEGQNDAFCFTLSRNGERHVQVPGGPRLSPQDDGEASDKSPPGSYGPEVSVQTDQSFLETGQQFGASLRYCSGAEEGST